MLNSAILRPSKLEPHQRPIPNWLIYSSVFFVMVAVFIKLWTPISLNRWPEAFYTLTFFYGLFKERQWLWKHPMVLGLFAAIIATPLLFFINYLQDPARAVEYAHFEKLIRVYLFLPIAYWLSFNRSHIYAFMLLSFFGFVTACLLDPNLAQTITTIKLGGRVDFGLKNWEHLSLWSGIFLVIPFSLLPNIQKLKSKPYKILCYMSCLIFALTCLFGLYAGQTRAVTLGLAACIPTFVLIQLMKSLSQQNTKRAILTVIVTFITTFTVTATLLLTDNSLKSRFTSENDTVAAILSGNLESVPNSSFGIRVNSWIEATSWIKQKPIIGWGGDVREHVIDSVKNFDQELRDIFGHLHNSIIEFMLGYGLIGTIISFLPIIWSFFKYKQFSNEPMAHYTVYANVIFLVANQFESYLFFWPGAFTLGLYLSPLLAIDLQKRLLSRA